MGIGLDQSSSELCIEGIGIGLGRSLLPLGPCLEEADIFLGGSCGDSNSIVPLFTLAPAASAAPTNVRFSRPFC